MNAPPHRLIQVDIAYINPQTDKVHLEQIEYSLDDKEEFVGICLVSTTDKKTNLQTKKVKT